MIDPSGISAKSRPSIRQPRSGPRRRMTDDRLLSASARRRTTDSGLRTRKRHASRKSARRRCGAVVSRKLRMGSFMSLFGQMEEAAQRKAERAAQAQLDQEKYLAEKAAREEAEVSSIVIRESQLQEGTTLTWSSCMWRQAKKKKKAAAGKKK
jgi:hypothetical protein